MQYLNLKKLILTMFVFCFLLSSSVLADDEDLDLPGLFDMFDLEPELIDFAIENLEELTLEGALHMGQEPLYMNFNRIKDLEQPLESSDAATKGYVDSKSFDPSTIPGCGESEALGWDGEEWSWVEVGDLEGVFGDVSSCSNGEALSWDGSDWGCVSVGEGGDLGEIPSCSNGEALTWDGSDWGCVNVGEGGGSNGDGSSELPNCQEDQTLNWDGGQWVCKDAIYKHDGNLDRDNMINHGVGGGFIHDGRFILTRDNNKAPSFQLLNHETQLAGALMLHHSGDGSLRLRLSPDGGLDDDDPNRYGYFVLYPDGGGTYEHGYAEIRNKLHVENRIDVGGGDISIGKFGSSGEIPGIFLGETRFRSELDGSLSIRGGPGGRAFMFYDQEDNPLVRMDGEKHSDGPRLGVSGDVLATGDFKQVSDIRLKENIEPIQDSLEKITTLNGVSFNRKDSNSSSLGLIAQDVKEVFPEAVTRNNDGYLGISYSSLSGAFVEAFKEQQSQIRNLEETNKELKDKLDEESQRIDELEAMLKEMNS